MEYTKYRHALSFSTLHCPRNRYLPQRSLERRSLSPNNLRTIMNHRTTHRFVSSFLILALVAGSATGGTRRKKRRNAPRVAISTKSPAAPRSGHISSRHVQAGALTAPTLSGSSESDSSEGEDLTVRQAAIRALGRYKGTVIVADPGTGRILTILNQKLASQRGFKPCSTIKIVAALAGLKEGVLQDRNTLLHVNPHQAIDLTEALAFSNNQFFATVGLKLGYERISEYAHLFGLGEIAGLNLEGEQAGWISGEPPAVGLGMMTSFGEGILMTPLELTALMTAVANGGTLYYLQHPRSQQEVDQFKPRVKRQLRIGTWLSEIRPGLLGAVEYGTARRAGFSPAEPIYGKTGTCTDSLGPTHLGWFGSYNESNGNKFVVVVLLTGGPGVSGPIASGIAGALYKDLWHRKYSVRQVTSSPIALASPGSN